MYLKRIELKGFKSFPDKLELDFKEGITTIVGPNGSGKSNIVDAIRWVLGEQSIKTLRGSKSEEVIFQGTENTKPLGFAEVSITLDNESRRLNTEFSEVKITRCLYRTGESEYKINDVNCRLKNIYDLFLNTGIGKEGYSIIGQGKIDEILSAKPKDRRGFFEEATGISKSRLDLTETTKKLTEERENLVRVNDIIGVTFEQLEPLRLQSEKASVFLEYKEGLKRYEVNLHLLNVDKLEREKNAVFEKYHACEAELKKKEEEMTTLSESKRSMTQESLELRTKLETTQNEQSQMDMRLEQKNSERTVSLEKISNLKQNIENKKREKAKWSVQIAEKQEQVAQNREALSKKMGELSDKTSLCGEKEEVFMKVNEIVLAKEEEAERVKQEIIDQMNDTFNLKAEIQNIKNNLENAVREEEGIASREEEQRAKIVDYTAQMQALEKEKRTLIENYDHVKGESELQKKKMEELSERRKQTEETVARYEREMSGKANRLELLETMEKNLEGYNKGVKEIMQLQESGALSGICGVVAELIQVDARYEIAVNTALGSRIQNIVVKTDEDAKSAVCYLKQNKCGRATFMPLSANNVARQMEIENLKRETGFVGIAADLLHVEEQYKKIIGSLIGNVVVFENMDTAIACSNRYRYGFSMVTLSGEQINTNGSLTGGEYKNQINILGRAREIGNIKEELTQFETDTALLREEIAGLEQKGLDLATELNMTQKEVEEKFVKLIKLDEKMGAILTELEQEKRADHDQENDKKELQNQKTQLIRLIEEKEVEVTALDAAIERNKARVSEIKEAIASEKEVREKQNADLINLRVQISSIEKDKLVYEAEAKRLEEEHKQAGLEVAENEKMMTLYTGEIRELENRIEEVKREEINLKLNREKLKQEILDIKKIESEIRSRMEAFEETLQAGYKDIEKLRLELYKIENTKEQCEIKIENICQKLMESYELKLEVASSLRDEAISFNMAQTKSSEYKQKIAELGNVNVDAISQHEELKNKYEFLTKQRDDIVQAEEKLEKLMSYLIVEMKKIFTENIEAINQKFNAVFHELFGGGYAKIELTDKEDVLESGIDILVVPPGKKVQNLMLLSGGEKALVAISLLFGILELKPSPFCVLDEIEAALDEANITRFGKYIRRLSGETQFIIITHRSGTMEIADYMYGITMERAGISKVISLELGNTEYASDHTSERAG